MDKTPIVHNERRSERRYRVRMLCRVTDIASKASFIATVTDFSKSGMRIELPRRANVGEHITLLLLEELVEYRLAVKWRSGRMVGLHIEAVGENAHLFSKAFRESQGVRW